MILGGLKLSIVQKVSILSMMLILITSVVLGVVFLNSGTQVLVERVFENIAQRIDDKGEALTNRITLVREDVSMLSSLDEVVDFLAGEERGVSEAETLSQIETLEDEFLAMMTIKKNYLHIRYMSANGDEIVRVDRAQRGAEAYVVARDELQNKAHRQYFQEAIATPKGNIYIGSIGLSFEHGQLVVPYQVVLRLAIPLFYEKSQRLAGVIVVNYDIGHDLDLIQASLTSGQQDMFIANSKGDYLYHPDVAKRFGFELGQHYRLQDDFPILKEGLSQESEAYNGFVDDGSNFMYMFRHLRFDPDSPDRFLTVGIREPYEQLLSDQRHSLFGAVFWMCLVVIVGVLVSLVFARRLMMPLQQVIAAIDSYSQSGDQSLDLPIHSVDEVGVLARSFQAMVNEVEEGRADLHELNSSLERIVAQRTQALRDSESLQLAILATMSDAVLTTNFSGIIRSVNAAAIQVFGYSESEMLGRELTDFVTGLNDDFIVFEGFWQADYRQGTHKSGDSFPIEVLISEGELGDEPLYTAVIRDVTERLRVEKLKTEFVSTVSHELRTPLTAIKGSLDILRAEIVAPMPLEAKSMLNIASSNAERLLLIVNDILDMQKIASGKMMYVFEPIDVVSFVEKAISNNQAYADQYKVGFKLDSTMDDQPKVMGDAHRLMQVMSNLMSNAAKFSPMDSVVEIGVAKEGHRIKVTVSDHGNGIPEAFRPHIFAKFSQADSSDTRQKGGSGLGLVITKSIIEDHQGEIGFDSVIGEGACFYFYLPVFDQ